MRVFPAGLACSLRLDHSPLNSHLPEPARMGHGHLCVRCHGRDSIHIGEHDRVTCQVFDVVSGSEKCRRDR